MLLIRISLGRWVFDLDFGPRPDDGPEDVHVHGDAELSFGFVAPDED